MTYLVETEDITYRRKKTKGRRQAIQAQFELELVHDDLIGDSCTCPDCHGTLTEIGSVVQRQELVFIPAQLKRINHVQHAYKCQACSDNHLNDKIIKAPAPKAPLAHSLSSASIIAHTIHQKFTLKVPNYRQEEHWNKLGLSISRKGIANWHIKSSQYYFEPLYDLLRDILLSQEVIHADETSYRVLASGTQLTYYWTFLSGKHKKKGITLYHHDKRRSGLVTQEVLGDYSGYVHCDMYGGYRQLEHAKLVGCWAHVRRKFFEAAPKQADKTSLGRKRLDYCDKLFALEVEWCELYPQERLVKRKEILTPLMTSFFDWCREQVVLPGSKLGLAIAYSFKHERTFRTVLEDGHLVLSNNMAERAIKSLVMGRKNWLFSQSFEGAKATAIIMSLLETAKRHGVNSEKYISYLLDRLPNEETLAKREVLEAYLPWAKEVQTNCQ
ncbi:transposase [Streptococcus dysgalactiae subsp. equisimilis]|uniref:Transposase n=2 Tax=Streptococcus dysgalactiae TaxID=1334 RepID=A0A9X9SHM5_STRDY|nr:transposase [Streptococcus dysgalactiae subsp. equisimilis]VTS42897.1 transposase [Streptococcus dysgalactiae subsp. equisimilis]VTS76261.1 transposase [Streptococcus dysgalactiae]